MRSFLLIGVIAAIAPSWADTLSPVSAPRLAYATYVGPNQIAGFDRFAVDTAGYVYVLGTSWSSDGVASSFLTKLNQTGSGVIWTISLPFANARDVASDSAGNVYALGDTFAPSGNVVTAIKLAPNGQDVIYSTQIRGAIGGRIALDRTGSAYITGGADKSFQTTPGAYLTTPQNASFAVKLNPAGAVEYATYIDRLGIGAIAVRSLGELWMAGSVCPTPDPSCDITKSGTASAIEKLDAQGAHVLFSNSFGGGRINGQVLYDSADGIAVDSSDSVWMVGRCHTFVCVPLTPDAIYPPGSGGYAVKFSPDGDLLYGSFIGFRAQDPLTAVTVDSQDNLYIVEDVSGINATLIALSADGATILVSRDYRYNASAMALDGNGGLYLIGASSISPLPGHPGDFCPTTPGAYQPFDTGGAVCVAKFDLTQNAPAQMLKPVNSASLSWANNRSAIVAPGEIVTLFGANLPPSPTVAFDGIAAPILYSDAGQINTAIPFEVSPPSTVLTVEGAGGLNLLVAPAAPAIFTLSGSGSGQVAAYNEDGTINSSENPAPVGSVVTFYITGAGVMAPPLADGELGPLDAPYPAPVLNIKVRVGGTDIYDGANAPLISVGQAPGLIAGAVQISIQIPAGTPSGDNLLVVRVGDAPVGDLVSVSTNRVTVAVQ